ncbi:hypothetical protein B0H34DRAFT_801860 [Crassisporium funariophilum]|nr:hypothetical protein B0H34DRAFT_801860 [Crassisporium funariophilum]
MDPQPDNAEPDALHKHYSTPRFLPATIVTSSPESRAAVRGQNQAGFNADMSNPLHHTATNPSDSTKKEQFAAFGAPGPLAGNARRNPSGLGGLLKRKSAQFAAQSVEQHQKGPQVLLGAEGIVRPGTSDPSSRAHQDRTTTIETPQVIVRAPVPQAANLPATSLLSRDSSFADNITNHAHTSNAHTVFDLSITSGNDRGSVTTSNLHGPARSMKKGPDLRQFFEPGRLTVGQKNSMYGLSQEENRTDDAIPSEHAEDGRMEMGQTRKRFRQEFDDDNDGSFVNETEAKRFKPNPRDGYGTRESGGYAMLPPFSPHIERAASRQSHSMEIEPRHSSVVHESPHSTGRHTHSRGRRTVSPSEDKSYSQYDPTPAFNQEHALDKLLGRDVDLYVKTNMDKYEHIAGKYQKVLDHVQAHMASKLTLYATVQSGIDNHNARLEDREKLLDAARKKLVKQSGNVLG